VNRTDIGEPDQSDRLRRVWLAAVLDRMAGDAEEERRIRGNAAALLSLKRERGLAGPGHIARWERLLALPLDRLRSELLEPSEAGAELRHAHLFAGCLPAREMNRLMAEARRDFGEGPASEACVATPSP
jgi:hypothetical protein